MKNYFLGLIVLMSLMGCGTIMESSRKTATIRSNKPVKVVYDGVNEGTGKYINVLVDNRSNDKILTVEDPETGEKRTVILDYEFNTWLWANILIDFGIISIPIDLINGSHKKLGKADYYIEY